LTRVGTIRGTKALEGYRLAVVGGWLGGVSGEVVQAWKQEVAAVEDALSPRDRAEVAWLDGVEAATRGDAAGVAAARQAVLGAGDPGGPLLARALTAFEPIMKGNLRPAADTLAQLESDRRWLPSGEDGWQIPVAIPVHRLMAARALAASGDTATAIRQLNWLDDTDMAARRAAVLGMFAPYALLERARLREGQGDTLQARYDYEELLRRFDRPVASLESVRQEAEQRYARLKGIPKAPGN
jgi:hypothetical protein